MSEKKGFYVGVKACGCLTACLVDDENTTAKEVAEFAREMHKTGRRMKHRDLTEKEFLESFNKCECPPGNKAAIEKAGAA